jgi:hypothetical protein
MKDHVTHIKYNQHEKDISGTESNLPNKSNTLEKGGLFLLALIVSHVFCCAYIYVAIKTLKYLGINV